MTPQKKVQWGRVRSPDSGDRGAHEIGPPRPIQRLSNFWSSQVLTRFEK